jgi:hypothetical protein
MCTVYQMTGLKSAGSNNEHFTLPFAKLWRVFPNQFTLAVYKAGLSFSQPINFCKASYLCNICHICDTSVHPSNLIKFLYSCGSQAEFTCMVIFRSEKNVSFACKTCRAKVNTFIDRSVFYENMLGGCFPLNQNHRTVLHMWQPTRKFMLEGERLQPCSTKSASGWTWNDCCSRESLI